MIKTNSNKKYLRAFDNYGDIKFEIDPSFVKSKIKKRDIDDRVSSDTDSKKLLLLLDNVLTDSECDTLIKRSEPCYEKLDNEYVVLERDSFRVLSDDSEFASVLFKRIEPHIIADERYGEHVNKKPCGFGVDDKDWEISKINHCFRFCKYVPASDGFKAHRDATYIENEDSRSILTILIYLNDSNADTIFYETTSKRQIYQTVDEEMKGGYRERARIRPKRGSVLIFNHNMIHAGDSLDLTGDNKYIVRSDIVYKCIKRHDGYNYGWMKDKYFIECAGLFREAFNQELDGNLQKASHLYQRANALRQCHTEL